MPSSSDLPDDWPDLNPSQQEAVTASIQPQLVVAGPGTGKTRVLVCRAAYLLRCWKEHIRPSHVLAITFTTRAAQQLKSRLRDVIGSDAQHVRAGTIHHFCYDVLRRHGDSLDLPEDFIVADETVTEPFWQSWFNDNTEWCKGAIDAHSYRQLQTTVSCSKLEITQIPQRLAQARERYDAMLSRRGMLDFDDLLVQTRDLLKSDSDAKTAIQDESRAVLVDEFQDTDPVQYAILQALGRPVPEDLDSNDSGSHLFCVADEDQSIYRFRGAEPENVSNYVSDFACTEERGTRHVLNINYRSNESIYEAAETVLDSQGRLKSRGDIETDDKSTAPVRFQMERTEESEMLLALQVVQRWIDEGVPHREIAVLSRWNRCVQDLERMFLRAGIACESSADDRLMNVSIVKKLHALLQLAYARRRNRDLDSPLEVLLDEMLPSGVVASIKRFQGQTETTLIEAFVKIGTDRSALRAAGLEESRYAVARVFSTLTNLLQQARDGKLKIGDLINSAVEEIGDPVQLLKKRADSLSDPACSGALRSASALIEKVLHDGGQIMIRHPDPQIARLWCLLLREAVGLEYDSTPERSKTQWVRIDQPRVVGPGDAVITTSEEDIPGRNSAPSTRADGEPFVIVVDGLKPDEPLDPELPELSTDTGVMHIGPEEACGDTTFGDAIASPTVRLFKLMQHVTGPSQPQPLFPEYVMVDLETTSTDVSACHVAEIGATKVVDGEEVDSFQRLVKLPEDLGEDGRHTLRDVCGLDPDEDFEGAAPLQAVWEDFCRFAGTAPLVAHNGQGFDFRVLERLQKEMPGDFSSWSATYDMLPAAAELFPDLRRYSAGHLRRELLGEEKDTEHRALEDCRDQHRILRRLQEERARQSRMLALEHLTPALVAALTYEDVEVADASVDTEVLFEVGYAWTLRGASPIDNDLTKMLPQSLTDVARESDLYSSVDEDALAGDDSLAPGLRRRIDALFDGFAQKRIVDGLGDLLTHLALWGEEEADVGGNVVTLSTYHSAKGLEFDRVICQNVDSGSFPPFFADTEEDRREARRLLYVGMTRAERRLVLTAATENHWGVKQNWTPYLSGAPQRLFAPLSPLSSPSAAAGAGS